MNMLKLQPEYFSFINFDDMCQKFLELADPGVQMMDMTQNFSFWRHKGNFLGKLKNNKVTQICLKYSLRCVRASILQRYLKNNRLSPKTMVPKNLSLKI